MNPQDKDIRSVLSIKHFIFNSITFERIGFRNDSQELPTSFSVNVEKQGENNYIVTLDVNVEKKGEFKTDISISGCAVKRESCARTYGNKIAGAFTRKIVSS